MTNWQIVVATHLTDEALAILKDTDGVQVSTITPTPSALKNVLGAAHALITRDDLEIDTALIEKAPHLRIIARVAPTVNGVDIDAATARGIMVMNTPGASSIAACEHTIALLLALSRRLITAHNSLRDGFWLLDRKRYAGIQLQGKTMGIIGLGRVGTLVALRCLAFGMTVLAVDPYITEDQIDERIQLISLRELLSRSDFISLHVPATKETRKLINAQTIGQMKDGVRLINTAHGSVVDEAALFEALKSGQIAGAAVDVYADEPPQNSPLIGLENVIHTPRIGDNTHEATIDLSIKVAEQVLDALRDVDYRNVVNMPIIPGISYETVRPYLHLAERMGTILHTLARNPVRRVAVELRGTELNGLIKPITVGLLKGLLEPILGEGVSFVNAPLLATERGWQITQVKGLRSTEYSNAVLCQITLEDGETITIAGILLDRHEPHIVQINQYRMNFVPQGHMLLMGSHDKPGVIGRIGTLMAENGVNIASWHTGRAEPGGHTLTVLTLDAALPDAVLGQIEALDFIRHLHRLEL